MERFAINKLTEWKNAPKRKPLVIMGARQVGKTWLMKEFGRRSFKKTAYVSFYNNEAVTNVFKSDYDIERILAALNIASGINITPADTLIIFDEIQNAPEAFESLKYFCEDAPQYHVVAADSLLGVSIHNGVSYPVGKVDILNLYPMNFREYLYAVNENGLADALTGKDYALTDSFYDKYLFHLKNYMYVGGMPEAVESFRKNMDYSAARKVQNNILLQYRGDFGKHIRGSVLPKINMVWESVPIQLAKENKKFFFGQIKKGGRSSEFEEAVQWLSDSGLVHKVNRVNEPHIPLAAYKDLSAYKLFLNDVGLLCAMVELSPQVLLEGSDVFVEFKGALTEQYVLQQLISDTEYTPYYYGTESASFEQDFILQGKTDVIPVEVKAGANVRSQSLKAFRDKYNPPLSVRFSLLKYKNEGWMVNIPLYAVCNIP